MAREKWKKGETRSLSVFGVCDLAFSIQHVTLCTINHSSATSPTSPISPHVLRFLLICLYLVFMAPMFPLVLYALFARVDLKGPFLLVALISGGSFLFFYLSLKIWILEIQPSDVFLQYEAWYVSKYAAIVWGLLLPFTCLWILSTSTPHPCYDFVLGEYTVIDLAPGSVGEAEARGKESMAAPCQRFPPSALHGMGRFCRGNWHYRRCHWHACSDSH